MAIHSVIDSVPWAKVYPGFKDAAADGLGISEIS